MKKIMIITPGFMPVPDVIGGAVESLITYILEQNEEEANYEIALYTIFNRKIDRTKFTYTYIKQYKRTILKKIVDHTRLLFKKKMKYTYKDFVLKEITKKGDKYDYILVENNIILLNDILNNCSNKLIHKIIYHLHNDVDTLEYTQSNLRKVVKNNIPIICVSQYVANRVKTLCEYNNVYILRNAIDFSQFDYNLYDKTNGISNNIVITYAGRLAEYKGVLELIQAFTCLCDKGYKNIKLNIIGSYNNLNGKDDLYTIKVKKAAKGYDVNFVGFIPHSLIYRNLIYSDIVIVPSICMEAAPLTIIEAQAAKNAVIATKHGGIPEYQEDNSCLYINEDHGLKNGIEEALEYLLKNKHDIDSLKNKGYINASKYTKKIYYQDFNKIIHEIGEK